MKKLTSSITAFVMVAVLLMSNVFMGCDTKKSSSTDDLINLLLFITIASIASSSSSSSSGGVATYSNMELCLTDWVDDSYLIEFKFYDEDNNGVWPSSFTHYETNGYGNETCVTLQCITGAQICYGAECGSLYWGVGLNNTHSCGSCCITCEDTSFSWDLDL